MENSSFILTSTLSTSYNNSAVSESIILYFLIPVILIFSVAIFFGTRFFKKKMALNREILNGKIAQLEGRIENFLQLQKAHSAELASLKTELEQTKNELMQWITEKKELEKEIENIKARITKSRKNDDIIIEYYMNENSGN